MGFLAAGEIGDIDEHLACSPIEQPIVDQIDAWRNILLGDLHILLRTLKRHGHHRHDVLDGPPLGGDRRTNPIAHHLGLAKIQERVDIGRFLDLRGTIEDVLRATSRVRMVGKDRARKIIPVLFDVVRCEWWRNAGTVLPLVPAYKNYATTSIVAWREGRVVAVDQFLRETESVSDGRCPPTERSA